VESDVQGVLVSHTDHQMVLLCDVMASGHPCIPSILSLSLTYYPLIAQLSCDPPPSYCCLGRKENLSLCSLKEYLLRAGRLLASGEPISKFGFDLGFVLNSFSDKVRRWLAGSILPAIASRGGGEERLRCAW
jgi:hypothetical protein